MSDMAAASTFAPDRRQRSRERDLRLFTRMCGFSDWFVIADVAGDRGDPYFAAQRLVWELYREGHLVRYIPPGSRRARYRWSEP